MDQKRDLRLIQSEKATIEAGIRDFLVNPNAGKKLRPLRSGLFFPVAVNSLVLEKRSGAFVSVCREQANVSNK